MTQIHGKTLGIAVRAAIIHNGILTMALAVEIHQHEKVTTK